MKIAQLPNGDEIRFPAGVPDDRMDAAIRIILAGVGGKTARLHNGSEVYFPGDTPDDRMDAAVRVLLNGIEKDGVTAEELVKSLLEAISDQKILVNEDARKMEHERRKIEKTNRESDRRFQQSISADKMKAAENIVTRLENLGKKLSPLEAIASSEKMDVLTRAVDNLSETVKGAVSQLTNILLLPSKISRNSAGTPDSIQRVRR